jgi:hypothetical protein
VWLPGVVFKASNPRLNFVCSPVWEIAIDAGMNSMFIEIVSELIELVLEIFCDPEKQTIEILAT